MGIELPKFTVQESEKEKSLIRKLLIPFFIITSFVVGLFGSGYLINNTNKNLSSRNAILEDLNESNQDKITQQEAELSILKADKKIKKEATLLLQKEYKNSIDIQNNLKSDIDFYERLLSPKGQNKGLRVFESTVLQYSDNKYKLKVALVQKIERANIISGKYQIDVVGRLNNQSKTVNINVKDSTGYKFKYYQNISLPFSLPEGFIAEQLVVKLFPKNKKSKTVEYTADWKTITK